MGASVSRRLWSGATIGADQVISAVEALRMFTINAAYNGFDERSTPISPCWRKTRLLLHPSASRTSRST
jgi:hypothetical protein